eukprot:4259942-Pyramimonas_sp.AAC.1
MTAITKSHVIAPGHLACMQVQTGLRGGLIVGSVYLEQGLRLGRSNAALLTRLGERLRFYSLLFSISGGWNVHPDALRASALPLQSKADVAMPTQ